MNDDQYRDLPHENIQIIKIVIVGDGASGKTSIASHFSKGKFTPAYYQTIGIDFFEKPVVIGGNTTPVNVQVCDIGGQSINGKMLPNYLYGADGVMLVYDVTDSNSLTHIQDWLTKVKQIEQQSGIFDDDDGDDCDDDNNNKPFSPTTSKSNVQNNSIIPNMRKVARKALIGNKIDKAHDRKVSREDHDKFAKDNNLMPFFCSAMTGESIDTSFLKLTADILGVKLEKSDLELETKPVKANIIQYEAEKIYKPERTQKKSSMMQQIHLTFSLEAFTSIHQLHNKMHQMQIEIPLY
ncbi:hypothetical protein SNEBB_010977 [Seison nebaliae]|nr:hypothetical protein SNEBB_010977 [Seison nebaliae]